MSAKRKVTVAMSGGVDSSVTAHLLKAQGYEVTGLFMKVYKTVDDAASVDFLRVCEQLGIGHRIVDVSDSFKKHVVDYFIRSYQSGETPNPCVMCNKHIKFGLLLDLALEDGSDYLATGHYARIIKEDGLYHVYQAKSGEKDQTYMFYNMNQTVLKHLLMPLGEIGSKEQVRAIARDIGLDIAEKGDSQEICFVPGDDYIAFLQSEGVRGKAGEFVDPDGHVIGRHRGAVNFTIGQRKGLGMSFGKPVYVLDIDAEKGRVVLGDNAQLMKTTLVAGQFNAVSSPLEPGKVYQAKIRYSAMPADCRVEQHQDGTVTVRFDKPQRAVTPGQSIVFYEGERLVGGAVIK